jgi:5-formyltetrahydrofolate cyclo-ligase
MPATSKSAARLRAKICRAYCHNISAGAELIRNFPASQFRGSSIGGYWPLETEMDVRPLLFALSDIGFSMSLPCVEKKAAPLTFRTWQPENELGLGAFGVREPLADSPVVEPSLILVPLLAFTPEGGRLGYGGGYYDRTLAALRAKGDVFACGVAYAGQEVPHLPTDRHDEPLDGILTEHYFKAFT